MIGLWLSSLAAEQEASMVNKKSGSSYKMTRFLY